MVSLCLSSSTNPLALYNNNKKNYICGKNPRYQCKLSYTVPRVASSDIFNPLRFSIKGNDSMLQKKGRAFGAVCCAGPFSIRNFQWISTISSVGEYGIWTACVALLVRLFFFIPGELELPFMALLFVIVAPYQVMNLRGTQQGAIIALVIAGYLAFQHFSRAGKLRNAFEQGSIVATLDIICVTVISCLFLI